jgi:LAO/AO transport system kinase
MIALADRAGDDWKPPIVATIAVRGDGIDELAGKLDAHWSWLDKSGERERRRLARAREEIAALALAALRGRMTRLPGGSALGPLAARVADGQIDPYAAADELLGALTEPAGGNQQAR